MAGVVPAGGQTGKHIPDYLAVLRDGSRWLIDVRPASLVKDEDAVRFAAAAGGGPAPESHRAHGDRRR